MINSKDVFNMSDRKSVEYPGGIRAVFVPNQEENQL